MHDGRRLPGEAQSLWLATTAPFGAGGTFPPEADVVIVGGGIVGISVAYQLRQLGRRVVLLEAAGLAASVTGNTTGKLTSQHSLRYARIRGLFGTEKAHLYGAANQWAVSWVHETSVAEGIDCEFMWAPAQIYSLKSEDRDAFSEELDACLECGLPARLSDSNTLPFSAAAVLQFENQARFHPRKFLLGLAKLAQSEGVQFRENIRVEEIQAGENLHLVKTSVGDISARHVVVATHYPVFDSGFYVAKLTPRRSYALAARVRGHVPDAMSISHGEPMHSFRKAQYQDTDVLIIGGGHHKVGQDELTGTYYRDIEDWAHRTFDVEQILFRWSTQDNKTPDGLPYIGRSPGHETIYVATGFDGWGMTNGVVSGKLISDQIQGLPNPWESVFEPARMEIQAIPKMVVENLNVAKHLVGDRLSKVRSGRPEMLERGEAAVFEGSDGRLCAYRDEQDRLFMVDAECPHMGCQLHWNSAERSWDCPCHGSRFAPDGEVLHGPATTRLAPRTTDGRSDLPG